MRGLPIRGCRADTVRQAEDAREWLKSSKQSYAGYDQCDRSPIYGEADCSTQPWTAIASLFARQFQCEKAGGYRERQQHGEGCEGLNEYRAALQHAELRRSDAEPGMRQRPNARLYLLQLLRRFCALAHLPGVHVEISEFVFGLEGDAKPHPPLDVGIALFRHSLSKII